MSHYANWEWGTQVASKFFLHRPVTFYKPLSNKYFDNYLRQRRMKQNMELYSVYKPKLLQRLDEEPPKAYFLVSDQSPGRAKEKKAYWVKFLNQDTACLHGIESYAKLFDLPVFYADVQRIKRGHYTIELEEICMYPENTCRGEITAKYMKKLEDIILKKPDDWLWSHKRWKLKKPDEMFKITFS
jgi:KDO2-lipid IV(A) lauroyltransferase